MENQIAETPNIPSLNGSKKDNGVALNQALSHISAFEKTGALTLEKALKGKQLSYYRNRDFHSLAGFLSAAVLDLAKAYNISGNVTVAQSYDIAEAIMSEYWYLKLAELKLFFKDAKAGKFGKVYDRLDQAIIFEWLNLYCAGERAALLEKQAQNGKFSPEDPRFAAGWDKESAEILNSLLKKSVAQKAEEGRKAKIDYSEETKARKALEAQFVNLGNWFTPQMNYHMEAAERLGRMKKAKVTLEQFMQFKAVKNLLFQLEFSSL